MKLSIFSPCHNSIYLYKLWETIKNQTYQDWEWIVLFNGKEKASLEFQQELDSRIKAINYEGNTDSIGLLKKTACSYATGEVLVEVDSDDLLTPDCLEEIAKAFQDPEVGFAFSDNAKLSDTFRPYNQANGWTQSRFKWEDKEYWRMHSFDSYATAGSFSFIWYLPDHVRAWRKSVYDELGGHNKDLDVLDDQELMLRTYLKTKVKHIDKCLYLYRISGENTWIKKVEKIQTKTVEIYNEYAYRIAERWADINKLKKIDLCGGFNKPLGYTSIDKVNGDIIADLDEGIPLPDNSVGVIRAHDAIEHLKDSRKIMEEAWRVLADGGMFLIQVPSTDGRGAWQDPTHVSFWNQNSFYYYTRKEQAQYIYNDKVKFQIFRLETVYLNDWCRQNNIPYVIAYLCAVKSNKRRPHPILI